MVAIWGRVPGLDETIERIDAVTMGDVRNMAANLANANAALALYGPVDQAPRLGELRDRLVA